jgi:putative tryptophan/tyrosine transport system substrate-binding protein
MNNRRRLIVALGAGAFGISLNTFAQTRKVPRIGILNGNFISNPTIQAFMQALRGLGYIDGQTASIVNRYADGDLDRLPALAAGLVAEKVDVIFAANTNAVQAAQKATTSIPIVFSVVSDPVGSRFVASLARPGGNITGTASVNRDLAAKRLQILKEAFPKTSRVAVLVTDEPQVPPQVEQVQQAAKRLGLKLKTAQLLSRADLESAQKTLRAWRADSMYVADSSTNTVNRKLLAELAMQLRLPAIYPQSQYATAGGLISYGPNYDELYRRAAQYVDKILKGAKPGDLPVEQPTKFEFVFNTATARALGIKIPNSVLVQATQVIE